MPRSTRRRSVGITSVRAAFAATAVLGLGAALMIAPFSQIPNPAAADESFAERINQKFVAAAAGDSVIHVDVSDIEKMPTQPAATSAASGAAAIPKYTGGGSPAEWMAAAGIPESDWGYVDYIAKRESGWNPNATNASSGACGVIQAHPCSKVPGSGYDPVANLRWANGYANGRYGSWAQAYAFWSSNHWW